jgi:hypothetical protein
MDEQDQWLSLYIVLFFAAFISGLSLLAARSRYRRDNAYEPWHARLAAAEGKPRSKASTGWASAVLLSVVALAAIWSRWSDPQVSATLRDIQAAQQQTTSGTKEINDSNVAEDQFIALSERLSTLQDTRTRMQDAMTRILQDNAELAERPKETQAQMAQDNASVAEQPASAPSNRPGRRERRIRASRRR